MATRDPKRSPDWEWDKEKPTTASKPDAPDRRVLVGILLLVGGFVLMILFFATVVVIKTQFTTPTTAPRGMTTNWGGRPNNPWGDPDFDPGPGFGGPEPTSLKK